jgi:hypothetical protein
LRRSRQESEALRRLCRLRRPLAARRECGATQAWPRLTSTASSQRSHAPAWRAPRRSQHAPAMSRPRSGRGFLGMPAIDLRFQQFERPTSRHCGLPFAVGSLRRDNRLSKWTSRLRPSIPLLQFHLRKSLAKSARNSPLIAHLLRTAIWYRSMRCSLTAAKRRSAVLRRGRRRRGGLKRQGRHVLPTRFQSAL